MSTVSTPESAPPAALAKTESHRSQVTYLPVMAPRPTPVAEEIVAPEPSAATNQPKQRKTLDRPRPIAAAPVERLRDGTDRNLTPNEVAAVLRYTDVDAVRRLIATGLLPGHDVGEPGRPRYLVSERELYAWFDNRVVTAPPAPARRRSAARPVNVRSARTRKRGLLAGSAPRSL